MIAHKSPLPLRLVLLGLMVLLGTAGCAAGRRRSEARTAHDTNLASEPSSDAPGADGDTSTQGSGPLMTALPAVQAQRGNPAPLSPGDAASEAAEGDAPPHTPGSGPQAEAAKPRPSRSVAPAPKRLVDIVANYTITVAHVKRSVDALRALAAKHGGDVTHEVIHVHGQQSNAQVVIRIPAEHGPAAFSTVETLGEVKARDVQQTDITKQYFDAELRLSGLRMTLARFREILTLATAVEDILRVEAEIARLSQEIEQIEGELRWLRDRAARATIIVQLRSESAVVEGTVEPEAHFYPGLRLGYVGAFGETAKTGYLALGVSFKAARQFGLDFDFLRDPGSTTSGLDGVIISLGGDFYSEFLGDGKRRFFNPYLGFRLGYALLGDQDVAIGGANLGLELFRTERFWLELESRFQGAVGEGEPRFILQPSLGASVAF